MPEIIGLSRLALAKYRSIHILHDTNTCRAVYTAQFGEAIYVLHAFQKKSKRGIATPAREIDLIRRRLADAERLHRQRQA